MLEASRDMNLIEGLKSYKSYCQQFIIETVSGDSKLLCIWITFTNFVNSILPRLDANLTLS